MNQTHVILKTPIEEAGAGDIVSIAGLDGAFVNQTICDTDVAEALPVRT